MTAAPTRGMPLTSRDVSSVADMVAAVLGVAASAVLGTVPLGLGLGLLWVTVAAVVAVLGAMWR